MSQKLRIQQASKGDLTCSETNGIVKTQKNFESTNHRDATDEKDSYLFSSVPFFPLDLFILRPIQEPRFSKKVLISLE